jgi:hypothetical protein
MQEAIELFREHDTIDQLGIGSVRDAFSNLLFPGTSVLHTRARYLLFIPWIYRRLERARVRSADVAAVARRDEIRLIHALLRGDEERDVIGARAKEGLRQLPSEAYWTSLHTFGLRLYPGTRAQYHRAFDAFRVAVREAPRDPSRSLDDEPVDAWTRLNWDITLDALEPEGFLERTDFELSPEEGEYLRDRIVSSASESFLAFLVVRPPAEEVDFPWVHPDVGVLPKQLADELELARIFSHVIWGAGLLYNLMLAELTESTELADHYTNRLQAWAGELPTLGAAWSWDEFWAVAVKGNPNVLRASRTRRFVEEWLALADSLGERVRSDNQARDLISSREYQVKGRGQARLHSLTARERWNGASGAEQLNYRWPVVQRVARDLQTALHPAGVSGARA